MIVCQACGTSNADGERFCGQCGAFLEWEGAVVDRGSGSTSTGTAGSAGAPDASGAAGTSTTAVAAADQPGTKERAGRTATGGADTAGGGAPVSGTPPAGGAGTAPASTDRPDATAAGSGATPPSGGSAGAGTGTTGTAASTETQPGLAEVQPGAPRRTRPVAEPQPVKREAPRPGDLICPQCGTGNDPMRRFCRSCGTRLDTAVVLRLPWWRRLLNWLFRPTKYQAGQRRQSKVRPHVGRIVRLLALVLVIALAVGFGPGLVRKVVNEVRDRTGDHVPISPSGFTASSARRGAVAARIADGATNQFWSPTGAGLKSWVEASFGQPVRLLDIVITPGISTRQDQFLTTGRPREVEILASPKSGKGKTFTLMLKDAPGAQTFPVEAEDIVRVRITVKSSYGPAAKKGTAIAEVEFFGRQ